MNLVPKFLRGKGCGKESYLGRDHDTCPEDISLLPDASDIYAGNEGARTADMISRDFYEWLAKNDMALRSMPPGKALGEALQVFGEVLASHGGQTGRRYRDGDEVMYLHIEDDRTCRLDRGLGAWWYTPDAESSNLAPCGRRHPW